MNKPATPQARYGNFKRFAFPAMLGIAMPIAMTLKEGGSFPMPTFLWQLVVYEVLAIGFGSFILPMGKIMDSFARFFHAEKPHWLYLIVSQIPGAIIFSIIMISAAIMMKVGVNTTALKIMILGLPSGIPIALTMQIVIDLVLDHVVKPLFFKEHTATAPTREKVAQPA